MTQPVRFLSALAQRTPEPPISWLMKLTLDHPGLISLAAGFTDNESLPVAEVQALLGEIFGAKKTGRSSLQYGSTQGDPLLRQLTAGHLQTADSGKNSTVYDAKRLLITHGSQQLLYLVTECLCDPGDIVLVEDPTYFVYLGIAQSHGLRCRGIALQPDGLDLAQLERTLDALQRSGELKRVKLLYLVSYFQNPSGVTTSFAKKEAALEILRRYERAAGHPIYLLEDAAYRELRFAGEDVPSALAAPRAMERVIYAGTYSKPFATGARVGFGLLPEPLLTAVLRVKGNHDFGTANLLQQLLARALVSCRYEAHLPVLRACYARKAGTMAKAIRAHFPVSVRWDEPRGGLYVWAKLPKAMKSGVKSKLFQTALKHDVLYVPGELCYASDPTRRKPNREMRLSFGGATERNIREGIARLGSVIGEVE
jgi:2-aminoadipate transaminase